jgi:hypothetical protein
MLGFGEEPIPEADFNNALKYVQKAYKLRGERLESLEERSDEGGGRVKEKGKERKRTCFLT